MGIFSRLFGKRKPKHPEGLEQFLARHMGESIIRILDSRNEFYRWVLSPRTQTESAILSLFELFALTLAVESIWPGETEDQWRRHILDHVHNASFRVLYEREVIKEPETFEALARDCSSRWKAALAKGNQRTSPSGQYWLAKEVLLTIRPEEDPDTALIDALEEVLAQNVLAWTKAINELRR